MTPESYRRHLARLSLFQEEAGIFFGFKERTGQVWAKDGPPLAVAMLLLSGLSREELDRLRKRAER